MPAALTPPPPAPPPSPPSSSSSRDPPAEEETGVKSSRQTGHEELAKGEGAPAPSPPPPPPPALAAASAAACSLRSFSIASLAARCCARCCAAARAEVTTIATTTARNSSVLQSSERVWARGGGAPASVSPTSTTICFRAAATSPALKRGFAASRIAEEALGGSFERAPRPARM